MEQDELSKHTRAKLLALAKQRGLRGISRLRKAELIAKLVATTPVTSPPAPPVTAEQAEAVTATSAKQTKKVLTARSTESAPELAPSVSPSSPVPTVPDERARVQEGTWTQVVGSSRASDSDKVTQGVAAVVAQPVTETQQDTLDSESLSGPEDESPPAPAPELPPTYNDNRLVLLVRDPYWLYAYWDFKVEQMSVAQTRLGVKDAQPVLRVFEVTDRDVNDANARNSVDIELPPFATHWYISVARADAAYCVEVGYRTPEGRFAALGRSNVVTTPRDEVSTNTTVQWWTPPERQAYPVPLPQSSPLPLPPLVRDQGSWPLGPAGREAPPPLPGSWSAQHLFSGNFGKKA